MSGQSSSSGAGAPSWALVAVSVPACLALLAACAPPAEPTAPPVTLPAAQEISMELDQAILARRSIRSFRDEPVSAAALARLLASAQGITGGASYLRAVPSAGALHPLELYVVAGRVEALPPGVYHYQVDSGALEPLARGEQRQPLARAALGQGMVGDAPLCLVVAAEYERTTRTYGSRGRRYVHMEVGHVAQNLSLTATALGLGTVSVGAFSDDEVKRVLGIPWEPLLIMPVGHPVGSGATNSQESPPSPL